MFRQNEKIILIAIGLFIILIIILISYQKKDVIIDTIIPDDVVTVSQSPIEISPFYVPNTVKTCMEKQGVAERRCLDDLRFKKVVYDGQGSVKDCLDFSNLVLRDECLIRLAVKESEAGWCLAISEKGKRDSCWQGMVLKDEENCIELYPDPENQQEFFQCQDDFLANLNVNNIFDPETFVGIDTDGDDLPDSLEIKIGTSIEDIDTDSDGKSDKEEWQYGSDPLKPGRILADTDGDNLIDLNEVFYGTDRFKTDTDNDGINDFDEVKALTNPLGSGDMDFDNNGLSDKIEKELGTNPSNPDTDGDRLY